MNAELTLLSPSGPPDGRLGEILSTALTGRAVHSYEAGMSLAGRRLLFAVSLPEWGTCPDLSRLLAFLRTHPGCLEGSVGGVIVDSPGTLYTKSAGRDLTLAANLAGCAFPGRPLVEGIGDLGNLTVQAKNAGCGLREAYRLAAADLADRVLSFSPPKQRRPQLLALHASSHATSNTLALWAWCRKRLEGFCGIREIGLRNGTVADCSGCPYTACLHFGERGDCFYGGVMVEEVYPAIRTADAVLLLCPNYNDALSANLTAAINRLTALYRAAPFTDTAVFAIVVSGYSGGDIVASQVVSAMNMNKGFWLPPEFCMLETANDAGAAMALPGITERLERFTNHILRYILPET